ncbi:MAG: VOC family protein [Acidimicrobiales bacterium]|jgi:catechol 2,3-dioxygenase-like lactoylglutathione lyase family enzyme|tara:strand:- start:96 stop:527 length:432 start_codon:yes stop_codon:yes gene_type:complete
MASRFHHAHLFATNLEKTLDFYERWFDAEVVGDHEFAGARNVMVRVGTGMLNFYDQAPNGTGKNAVHHLGFQVDDLADLAARMSAAGFELRSPIRELPELDYLMIEAPDGVLLEVFEYKGSPDGAASGLDAWFGEPLRHDTDD